MLGMFAEAATEFGYALEHSPNDAEVKTKFARLKQYAPKGVRPRKPAPQQQQQKQKQKQPQADSGSLLGKLKTLFQK
jgi:hypothetical protein